MINYTEYYRGIVDSNFEENKKCAEEAQNYILNSTAKSHGIFIHTLYIPKIFTSDMADYFDQITKTMYKILEKVITEYENNTDYRKLFGFDEKLERLILRKDRYNSKLPIARLDIFFNEDDYSFKFCEFNTDGSSAMNEDRELNNALSHTLAYRKFANKFHVKSYELFNSWVREFTNILNSADKQIENPHIAIVDFIHGKPETEFIEFQNAFINNGYTCEICNITDLMYDGKSLLSPTGKKIDAIYRRAVTCDIMRCYDEVKPFIDAVLDENVILIGDFKTQIAHNKRIFKILHCDMTKSFLTPVEIDFIEQHIPMTVTLSEHTIKEYNVLNNKNSWVIKPEDSYASKGVYAGIEFDNDEDWKEKVLENADSSYLLQEFCPPYETANIDLLHDKDAKYRKYSNITGLFVYNGHLSGIYTRIAKTGMISTQYSEMSLPTVVVTEK